MIDVLLKILVYGVAIPLALFLWACVTVGLYFLFGLAVELFNRNK